VAECGTLRWTRYSSGRPSLPGVTSLFLCTKKRVDAAHGPEIPGRAAGRRLARASKARVLAVRNVGAIAVVCDGPCFAMAARFTFYRPMPTIRDARRVSARTASSVTRLIPKTKPHGLDRNK
jgi:hypothetical protein